MNQLHTGEKLRLACNIGIEIPRLFRFGNKEEAEMHTAKTNKRLTELSDGLYMEKLNGIPVKILGIWNGKRWENFMVVITQDDMGVGVCKRKDIITCTYNVHHKNFAHKYFKNLQAIMKPNSFALISFTRHRGKYYYSDISFPDSAPYIASVMKENSDIFLSRIKRGFYTSIMAFNGHTGIDDDIKIAYGYAETIKGSFKKCYQKIESIDDGNMLYRPDAGVYECRWYYIMQEDESLTRRFIKRRKDDGNKFGTTTKRHMDTDSNDSMQVPE